MWLGSHDIDVKKTSTGGCRRISLISVANPGLTTYSDRVV